MQGWVDMLDVGTYLHTSMPYRHGRPSHWGTTGGVIIDLRALNPRPVRVFTEPCLLALGEWGRGVLAPLLSAKLFDLADSNS